MDGTTGLDLEDPRCQPQGKVTPQATRTLQNESEKDSVKGQNAVPDNSNPPVGDSGQTLGEPLVEQDGVKDESGLRTLEAFYQAKVQLGQPPTIFGDFLRRLYNSAMPLGQISPDLDRPPPKAVTQ